MINKEYFDTDLGRYYLVSRPGKLLFAFLNGEDSFSTYEIFKPIIDGLPENVGFLAVDKLGAGHSDNAGRDYTAGDDVNAIKGMIDDLNPEKVVLVAHSAGGVRGILLAAQMDKIISFVGIEPTTLRVLSDPELQKEYAKHSPKNMEKFLVDQLKQNYPGELADQVMQTATQKDQNTTDADVERIQRALQNIDWQRLPKLPTQLPSIVIAESFREAEYADSEYHTSDYHFVALGNNHYIQVEEPVKISQILNNLISKVMH